MRGRRGCSDEREPIQTVVSGLCGGDGEIGADDCAGGDHVVDVSGRFDRFCDDETAVRKFYVRANGIDF